MLFKIGTGNITVLEFLLYMAMLSNAKQQTTNLVAMTALFYGLNTASPKNINKKKPRQPSCPPSYYAG